MSYHITFPCALYSCRQRFIRASSQTSNMNRSYKSCFHMRLKALLCLLILHNFLRAGNYDPHACISDLHVCQKSSMRLNRIKAGSLFPSRLSVILHIFCGHFCVFVSVESRIIRKCSEQSDHIFFLSAFQIPLEHQAAPGCLCALQLLFHRLTEVLSLRFFQKHRCNIRLHKAGP